MCPAIAPQVLPLDEPLAGMGAEETERITMMVNGAVIASDLPEAVRANPAVQAAYPGGEK